MTHDEKAPDAAANIPERLNVEPPPPPAIARLMDEVRQQQETPAGCFDRAHNRHNR